jgi:hypothetical protein
VVEHPGGGAVSAAKTARLEKEHPAEMLVIRDWDLSPDADMVLRAQGADPEGVRRRKSAAVGIAEQAVAAGRPLLEPVVVSTSFQVREFRHDQVRLEGGGHLSGPLIAEQLRAAQSVLVAVCSIGPALEMAASGGFREDPAMTVALDAFGSAAVGLLGAQMCQRVDEQAAAQGLRTTIPLSPGLVGWPLARGQRQLFALMDPASGGISLNDRSLMVPRKSTSMVIGLGRDVLHAGEACDYCSVGETCRYRQNHGSLHG